ncbi:Citrate (Si)-synthase [Catenulispora acidiphila DSM 44928]|uniref:Citrate synthase n=1 Tax=Catenulispora acidiphila (strain DSM 44928 / JCM 14897 / NBRC 102108 / NRRL B-24433 / ID139908) TaxID=479433 RepID=C7QIC7_CATAD|nr:citrate synthase/methylcitrate synthase [Catenulispora acidiphila]ACU75004.1 Citrate (Si)-synthase [Catenulispora acidiphila DSM 44928]
MLESEQPRPTRSVTTVEVPRGLAGVIVTDTKVGDVRGEEGFYHYRQYNAVELAEKRTLEDVWVLMIDGYLPDAEQRAAFIAETTPLRHVPDKVKALLPAIAEAVHGEPMNGLRAALPLLAGQRGMRPLYDIDEQTRRADALFVSALAPTILTAVHRLGKGLEMVEPRDDLSYAANYLYMLTGSEPTAEQARAIEQYLISTVDHGFNNSTFTARVIASTGADLAAAVTGALGSLSGPLHGGAPSRALDTLDEIGTPDKAEDWVREQVEAGSRIMGFGHPVYRTDDPRSIMLRGVAQRLGGDLVDFAVAVEEHVLKALAELKPGRQLYTNVEFYAGVVMELSGVPRDMFTPTFATSRVIGWCANILEQAQDSKIIRPAAHYSGVSAPQPLPED